MIRAESHTRLLRKVFISEAFPWVLRPCSGDPVKLCRSRTEFAGLPADDSIPVFPCLRFRDRFGSGTRKFFAQIEPAPVSHIAAPGAAGTCEAHDPLISCSCI